MGRKSKKAGKDFDSRTGYKENPCTARVFVSKKKKSVSKPVSELYRLFAATHKPEAMNTHTEAKLSKGGKEWLIYYYFRNPATGEMERFRERFNMNRIKDLTKRERYAKVALDFINGQLDGGFSPYTHVRRGDRPVMFEVETIVSDLSAGASKTSKATYGQVYRRFSKWLESARLLNIGIHNFTLKHAQQFQKWMRQEELSAKTINSTISHMGLFWDNSSQEDLPNYWRKLTPIKDKRAVDDSFEPLTEKELQVVFEYLRKSHPDFARLALFIFYAWGRTVEFLRLKIEDIDLENDFIRFPGKGTKNKKPGFVQIVPELKSIIKEMKLENYPPNYYVFSDKFKPGSTLKNTNEVSERWRDLVKEKLKINKSMYALKHTGNVLYLVKNKGNINLKWQQMQNRHSSAAMTERYCRSLGAYFVDTSDLNFPGF